MDDEFHQEILDFVIKFGFEKKLKLRSHQLWEGIILKDNFEKVKSICRSVWEIKLGNHSTNARIFVKEEVIGDFHYYILVYPLKSKTDQKIDKELKNRLEIIDNYNYETFKGSEEKPQGIIELLNPN